MTWNKEGDAAKEYLPPDLGSFMDIHTSEELRKQPPKQWLVNGLISKVGVSCIYGPPGAGKSFLALDMCAKISQGQIWFGHETKQAPVIYFSFEGMDGFGQRVAAYSKYHGAIGDNLRVMFRKSGAERFSIKNGNHREAIIYWARKNHMNGGIIVMDTMIRSTDSFDENSSQEMTQVMEAATDLTQSLECNVTLVHHSGSSGNGPRGSTALRGAWDDGIKVCHERTDHDARWHWETDKIKDGPASGAQPFQLRVVDMSTTQRVDYSSCVVISGGEVCLKPLPKGHT